MERPTPAQIQYMEEHITDDRRPDLIAAYSVAIALAYIAVFLRLIARRRRKAPLLADDWYIIAGLIFTTAFITAGFIPVRYGFGRHVILVTNPAALNKCVLASQVLYCFAITPIKFSVLYLYKRVFPTRNLHLASLVIGLVVLGYNVGQVLAILLQCFPLSSVWTGAPGKCINTQPLFTGAGTLNVITDFAILSLPVSYLWKLKVTQMQRLQLFAIFALGSCVCIISIIRVAIAKTTLPYDPSWGNVNTGIWSGIEPCIGVVSACLPTLRPLFYKDARISQGEDSKNYTSDFHRSNTIRLSNRVEQSHRFTVLDDVETGDEDGTLVDYATNGDESGRGDKRLSKISTKSGDGKAEGVV